MPCKSLMNSTRWTFPPNKSGHRARECSNSVKRLSDSRDTLLRYFNTTLRKRCLERDDPWYGQVPMERGWRNWEERTESAQVWFEPATLLVQGGEIPRQAESSPTELSGLITCQKIIGFARHSIEIFQQTVMHRRLRNLKLRRQTTTHNYHNPRSFTPYRTPSWSDNDSLSHRVTETHHETLHALNADMSRR